VKVLVKDSGRHGLGVFAISPIHRGEPILDFTGPRKTREELQEGEYHLQIGEHLYLGASGEADDYVNHSCEPNAGFRGSLVLVAKRDIPAGEEITWDYSTAIDEPDFPGFPCQCGLSSCRGTVHSFRHLDNQQKSRLRPWLLAYLKEKYFPGD